MLERNNFFALISDEHFYHIGLLFPSVEFSLMKCFQSTLNFNPLVAHRNPCINFFFLLSTRLFGTKQRDQ